MFHSVEDAYVHVSPRRVGPLPAPPRGGNAASLAVMHTTPMSALRRSGGRSDADLRRYRSRLHPDWVVYPRGRGGLSVIDEAAGRLYSVGRRREFGARPVAALVAVVAEFDVIGLLIDGGEL